MPRRARIHFVSLKSSLVNLPISIYGPLLERSIVRACFAPVPQINVHLTLDSGHKRLPYISDATLKARKSRLMWDGPEWHRLLLSPILMQTREKTRLRQSRSILSMRKALDSWRATLYVCCFSRKNHLITCHAGRDRSVVRSALCLLGWNRTSHCRRLGNHRQLALLAPSAHLSFLFQEIHASHVESTLLSQVRVAKVGQEIDVWVLGHTRVRLLVGGLC